MAQIALWTGWQDGEWFPDPCLYPSEEAAIKAAKTRPWKTGETARAVEWFDPETGQGKTLAKLSRREQT